jgi:AcrR family transcriptional regulator
MQDIIDECGISRGGIYLYFSSKAEIFQEIIVRRSNDKFAAFRRAVADNEPFDAVLGEYINLQKERLGRMENSLLRAMYEYIFSKSEGATQEFRGSQLEDLRKSVRYLLTLGVQQGIIPDKDIVMLADHFVIVIEGLGVLALAEVLTEKIIDEQFAMLNGMIEGVKIKA